MLKFWNTLLEIYLIFETLESVNRDFPQFKLGYV